MAEYVIHRDHSALILGQVVNLTAGQLITDAQFNIPLLIAAGFAMVQLNLTSAGIPEAQWPQGALVPPWCPVNAIAPVLTINTGECSAWYFGRAPRVTTQFDFQVRVTTAQTGVTWSEVFLAKGTLDAPGNKTLTVVGFTSELYAGTGLVSTGVTVAGGQSIAAGEDLWIGFAKLSSGSPVLRSSSFGDDLQRGYILDAGNVRPSTILGVPTAFPVAATTKALPQFAVYV